ncbi:MAG: DNA adenine methylase [Candidatus Nitrosocosmicus sp.]
MSLSSLHIKDNVYPFVKWAGGKAQLLNILDSFIPDKFNNYFEPFLGGGSFFYHLIKKTRKQTFRCFLSDTNCELINAYAIIKNNIDDLICSLSNHQEKYYENPKEYFYALRNTLFKNDIERASRFVALNKTCFNGLYRVNRKGLFNVPMGSFKKLPLICNEENLRNIHLLFKSVNPTIECKDYKDALSNAKENDFVYLDPPYKPVSETAYFTKYTNNGFGDHDQIDLAKVIKDLNDKKCKILLSNSNTEFIRKLYSNYNLKEVKVMRAINSKGSKRIGHTELIISNY